MEDGRDMALSNRAQGGVMIDDTLLSTFFVNFVQLYCMSYSRDESGAWFIFVATFMIVKVEVIKLGGIKLTSPVNITLG